VPSSSCRWATPSCQIGHRYAVCILQGGWVHTHTHTHTHTPPCKIRHAYTVCILQGGPCVKRLQQREHERSALVIEAEAETEAASLIQVDINTHTIITICFVWAVCDLCRGLL
jgi:hypothetical protein